MPAHLRQRLADRASRATSKSLSMARECLRLQQALGARDVPSLILKGVPLGLLAYGELALKEAWDIDVLVGPEDVGTAREVLDALGYHLAGKPLTEEQIAGWVAAAKELVFVNPRSGLVVELHWKLVDNLRVLHGVGAQGPSQDVALAAGTLRTLADEPLFAYLCLHGTYHSWSRLKWLADLNAFLAARDGAVIESLVESARHYGAHRAASVALHLCQRLFLLDLPPTAAEALEDSVLSRALERSALKALDYKGGGLEHRLYTPEWARHTVARLLTSDSLANLAGEAAAFWAGPTDRLELILPKRLQFLYSVLRIPLWLRRRVLR